MVTVLPISFLITVLVLVSLVLAMNREEELRRIPLNSEVQLKRVLLLCVEILRTTVPMALSMELLGRVWWPTWCPTLLK